MKTRWLARLWRESTWNSPIVLHARITHRPPPLNESNLEYFFLLRGGGRWRSDGFLPKFYWPSPPKYTRDVPLPLLALCPIIPEREMAILLEGIK